jgi:eukaryotic translation initiation factor 2C
MTDCLQTHALCYMFGRSTTSVGLTMPSYYADLAADRARCYARNVYAPTTKVAWDPAIHPINLKLKPAIENTTFYI